jgi:acylaminoacyl-peptidase
MDYFNMEYASDPQISPDGKQIVYQRNFADVLTDTFYSNLWIVNSDGTNNRPLTTGKVNDGSARWSPDGKRLAYVSTRDGLPQIFMRWMDTGQEAAITNMITPPMGLSWSPDGKWLALATLVPAMPLTIGTMPPAPPGAQWAAPAKYTDKLVFRFDGVGEIPPGFTHLFVVPAEGGTPRQITSGDYHHGGLGF